MKVYRLKDRSWTIELSKQGEVVNSDWDEVLKLDLTILLEREGLPTVRMSATDKLPRNNIIVISDDGRLFITQRRFLKTFNICPTCGTMIKEDYHS